MPPELIPTLRQVFAPVGKCIYCGSREKLQDEHMIAYSLNGTAILPKASCEKCAVITSQIERSFTRGSAWAMRAALGFQSRGKKKKKGYPTSFPVRMLIGGKRQSVEVPLTEFPLTVQLPIFASLPGYLSGQYDVPIKLKETVLISLRENARPTELLQEIGRRYHADEVEVDGVEYRAFARLIAKSAYALAVAEHGISNIKEKYVVPAILGRADDLGTWLGSSAPLQAEQVQHITQVQTFSKPSGESMIVVYVKPFAFLPSPGYVVVVASKM
jgi:hypothetical protein